MSNVRKDERSDNPLTLPLLARDHAKYVIQITKNPKWFPPEYNRAVTDDLVKEAKDINRLIWAANNIRVTGPKTYETRRAYQSVLQRSVGGRAMLKIVRRLFPLEKEGELNRLNTELEEERQKNAELEDAVIELGELYAEQDDALVELAGMIEEGE